MNAGDCEVAVSEVVGFILILGILVAAFSVYMVYVIPAEGRDDEISHMDLIKNRFIDYKISLDSLWINAVNYRSGGVSLSTSFDLGTGGGFTQGTGLFLPLIRPVPSGGLLEVNSRHESMTIDLPVFDAPYTSPMGDLTYRSENRYWIQQKYYYQMGGVFLSQDTGSTAMVSPLLSIYRVRPEGSSEERIRVKLTAIQIDGNQNIAGSGPVRIESRLRESLSESYYPDQEFVKITVDVNDPPTAEMWNNIFSDALMSGGIEDGYEFGEDSPAKVWLKITGNNHVDFNLTQVHYVTSIQNAATGVI